jgi:hypothetical protein
VPRDRLRQAWPRYFHQYRERRHEPAELESASEDSRGEGFADWQQERGGLDEGADRGDQRQDHRARQQTR